MSARWEIEISHDGDWPFPWYWVVRRWTADYHLDLRTGYARTKDRAQRKVAKAKLSMERDDLRFEETAA